MMRNETTALRNAPKLLGSLLKMSDVLSGRSPVNHAVKVVTTAANASAMIRPVAISIRLPLRMKFLKPVMVPPPDGPRGATNERMHSTLAVPGHRQELRQRRRGDLDGVGSRGAD